MHFEGLVAFFGVEDLEKARQFYGDLLGLALFKDQGACLIYEVVKGSYLGFCNHVPVLHGKKTPIITLLISDVDSVYEKIKAAGYPLQLPPAYNERFKIYHFFVEDPSGYALEVQRFEDEPSPVG